MIRGSRWVALALGLASLTASAKSKEPKGWRVVVDGGVEAAGIEAPSDASVFAVGAHLILWGTRKTGDGAPHGSVLAVFDTEGKTWRAVGPLAGLDDLGEKLCAAPMPVGGVDKLLVAFGRIEARICRRVAAWFDPKAEDGALKRVIGTTLTTAVDGKEPPWGAAGVTSSAAAAFYRPAPEGAEETTERLWVFDLGKEDWVTPPAVPPGLGRVVDAAWRGDELMLLRSSSAYEGDGFQLELLRWRLGDDKWQAATPPTDRPVLAPRVWGDATRIVQCCGLGRHTSWNPYRWISPHETKYDFVAGMRGATLEMTKKVWTAWDGEGDPHEAGVEVVKSPRHLVVISREDGSIRVLKAGAKPASATDAWRVIAAKAPTAAEGGGFGSYGDLGFVVANDQLWMVRFSTGRVERLALNE
jgi:hypothetical protein